MFESLVVEVKSINPPIRGSIDFVRKLVEIMKSINPPIRGSIEKN